jgi:hypothetical protein
MSTQLPELIPASNLSYAWGEAFLQAMTRSQREISPMIISLDGFVESSPAEDSRIRAALDDTLEKHKKQSCANSAFTIFPHEMWSRRKDIGCAALKDRYMRMLPRLKSRDHANCYGTYFQRMVAFQGVRAGTGKVDVINQLDFIIQDWTRPRARKKRPRQSSLQAACFDPLKDHTGQSVRGFPCLQQVSFAHDESDGLAVSAYYPTQYLFDRAYGNYLGLCHLGQFMAHELRLQLRRVNCYIGRPELGKIAKTLLEPLEERVRALLPKREESDSV